MLKTLNQIQRMNGYRLVLYQTLEEMMNNGHKTLPTAYEILAHWRNKFKDKQQEYPKICVKNHSFDYENQNGKLKTVNIKALQEAIDRLITS